MTNRTQFDYELEELKLSLIKMGDLVIKNIHLSLKSFIEMNSDLANKIIKDDKIVNQFEYDIEKDCMRIILKEQPVARDLRLITSVLKMITDLERIGDHAADISKLTVFMEKNNKPYLVPQVNKMVDESEKMIKMALESFVNQDQNIALKVIDNDDIVDDYFTEIQHLVAEAIRQDNIDADYAIYLMMAAKYLERIGDHAVNIAEWVIFSIVGHHRN
ncbi:MAG: phosphate signaling complex protein PhoU [Candidatus Izemoplasmatales bacterium]|nr:phosphate signaling complex protein PhoU [Candidatus Izemoplasmatales bacterium]MDY0138509.1 phosphate signaling complex protein PhoU [Candidatus Izemoplasmatales bacterium]